MATKIRTNLSKNSKHYISKERRLELKHFCMQYHEWEEELLKINYFPHRMNREYIPDRYSYSDPTLNQVMMLESYEARLEMVRAAIRELNDPIGADILRAVTNDLTWPYFEARGIACGRDYFYDRLKKFFFILDKIRM